MWCSRWLGVLLVVVFCCGVSEGFGIGDLFSLFGEEDLEGKPVVRFIIFFAQRSGSKWLTTLLNAHPNIICQHELLRKYTTSNMSYFEKVDNVWANFFGVDIGSASYEHLYHNPHDPFAKPPKEPTTTIIKQNLSFRGERVGETEDGKPVYRVKKGKNVKAIGFKIPYSDGLWTNGAALRNYIIENKIRVIHLVRENIVRRLISQISNRLDETQIKSKKRTLENRKKIYSRLEQFEESIDEDDEAKKEKKKYRKGRLDKLRAKIGGGHQPHPKTEEEKKKLRDLKPRIAKSNFLARLNIFDEQLGTAKEILARWKLGIDEYGDKYEPVQVLEVVYEELSANQKSILHGIQDFISMPRFTNSSSDYQQIHFGDVQDLVYNPSALVEVLTGTKYERFLYD